MIGLEGEVRKTLSPKGEIFVRGEIWDAKSIEGKIPKGTQVEVVDVKGNHLFVKKKQS